MNLKFFINNINLTTIISCYYFDGDNLSNNGICKHRKYSYTYYEAYYFTEFIINTRSNHFFDKTQRIHYIKGHSSGWFR